MQIKSAKMSEFFYLKLKAVRYIPALSLCFPIHFIFALLNEIHVLPFVTTCRYCASDFAYCERRWGWRTEQPNVCCMFEFIPQIIIYELRL